MDVTQAGFSIDWNMIMHAVLLALAGYFGGKSGGQKGANGARNGVKK